MHGDIFNPASYGHSVLSRLRARFGAFVVRRTSRIRVVSDRIKQSLLSRGVAQAAITVLPIQADLDQFLAVGRQRSYVHDQPVRFLYVGRFSKEKNLLQLLGAFAKARHDTAATLTLMGEGPEQSVLEETIAALQLEQSVTIRPWSDAVAATMAKHDVLCLASQHEGWGMVLLEAAAAGMAIVTTDVGCVGEVIQPGQAALVVPVGDDPGYAAALSSYLHNRAQIETHGRAGHAVAATVVLSPEMYRTRLLASYEGKGA